MNISYWLLGYVKVVAEGDNILDLINLCMQHKLPYREIERAEGGVCFLLRLSHLKTLETLCKNRGIEISVRKKGGLPIWLHGRRHRYGLMVGVIAAAFTVILAQNFIWRIDVIGNQSMTTSEILGVLENYGLKTGSFIPKLNTDKIQNRVLIDTDKISWISVNINGNTASVEVREASGANSETDLTAPANLIATKAGRIVQVQLLGGNAVVKGGDIVTEGQLLVSGLFDSKNDGFRVTRAKGKVYAETSEEFYIKIPYDYQKKVYTGAEYCDKYLNFFGFSVKISKKSGNIYKL